jgi:hypothetical protein
MLFELQFKFFFSVISLSILVDNDIDIFTKQVRSMQHVFGSCTCHMSYGCNYFPNLCFILGYKYSFCSCVLCLCVYSCNFRCNYSVLIL